MDRQKRDYLSRASQRARGATKNDLFEQKYPRFFQQVGTKHFAAVSPLPPPQKKIRFWGRVKKFSALLRRFCTPPTLTAGFCP